MKDQKPTKAFIIVKKSWVATTGVDILFQKKKPDKAAQNAAIYVIDATSYRLVDSWFAEVEFYPEVMKGHRVKVLVPKDQIVTVIEFGSTEDAKSIGFQRERERPNE